MAGMRLRTQTIYLIIAALSIGLGLSGCDFQGDTTTPATLAARTQVLNQATTTPLLSPTPSEIQVEAATETQAETNPLPTATPSPGEDYFSQSYALSQNSYVIPLTLRHVSEQWATFFFELSTPARGLLVYRSIDPNSPRRGEVEIPEAGTRHMLTLEGLSPGGQYEAMVLLNSGQGYDQQPGFNGKEWGRLNFHTPSGEHPLRVGIVGDASFGDEATQRLVALMAAQDLNFVLHTGDVVYETDPSDLMNSYVVKYFEPFAPLLQQMPVYTVLGNHDYDAVLRWQDAPFYDYAFPPFPDPDFSYPEARRANQYYAFHYQDVQFLMLDSQVFYGVQGRGEQDAWLAERLADPRFRITIPVFHVSPYSSSVVHPDDSLPVRYSWNPRFEAANVPVVFSGHFHHYERHIANGITYIVSGGGSSTLYAQGESLPESQVYARRTHFVLLEIFEERSELRAISVDGEVLDQATISLN